MMDSYITSRGSTVGFSFDYLTTINSTSFQLYTIDNIDQYIAVVFYLVYPNVKTVVSSITMNMERFKLSTSVKSIQPAYYDGAIHYGYIYYNDSNSIYGKLYNADSVEIYGIK